MDTNRAANRAAMELLGSLLSVPMTQPQIAAATLAMTTSPVKPPTTAAEAATAIDRGLMTKALNDRNIDFDPSDLEAIVAAFAKLIFGGLLMSTNVPPDILNCIVAYVVPPGKP